MPTFTQAATPLKLFGVVLTLAVIAAVAATITLTAGPTQAQSQLPGRTPAPTPTPTPSPWEDPQPCGPGADTAAMSEPHERTTGHYALFDTYWESTTPDPGESTELDPANTGILHTNTCPPYVSQTTEKKGLKTVTVTKYSESGVDIDELIIHVTDLRKVAVVATDAEATAGQLSLDRYDGLRQALGLGPDDPVPADAAVWWLRTDDPSTPDVDESAVDDPDTTEDETTTAHSNGLSLGFSTRHLDDHHWAKKVDDGNGGQVEVPPLRYAFEVEHTDGIPPEKHPHVLSYRIDHSGTNAPKQIWSSVRVHTQPLDMEPERFESLEWIFTQPGTYETSVHLIGWVARDRPEGAPRPWKAISSNITESSEVKTYTIQVGDELLENEPPVFGANRAVTENSPAGTLLGAPIPIFEGEASTFYYSLSGEGHEQFAVEAIADPHSVQIKVADGADLDYETRPVYELRLNVTDKIDHESNPDPTIDDSLAVRIALEDIPTSVVIEVDNYHPTVQGDPVTFTAVVTDFGEPHPDRLTYRWVDENGYEYSGNNLTVGFGDVGPHTLSLRVSYLPPGGDPDTDTQHIDAEPVTVTWTSQ